MQKVKFKFNDSIKEAILIEDSQDYYTLKLSSGYNINIRKEKIEIISSEKIEPKEKPIILSNTSKRKESLPKILLLHTGGTIASKVDYRTGAVSSSFTADEILNLYPQIQERAEIRTEMISNIFSEDMRFKEYNKIIESIKNYKSLNEISGIIISHGTDTMHYSATAIHYAIRNLNIPIIFVGAQRSSDRASSDAFWNLLTAVNFIISQKDAELAYRRVGICMHENMSDDSFVILDSINSKKLHSTRRDAFKQINYEPFAKIKNDNIEVIRNDLLTPKTNENLIFTLYNEDLKIGFFKSHPNMFDFEIDMLKVYDAVILEGTGVGNFPESENNDKQDKKILNAFKIISKNTKLISSVQTVYGEVSLDIYSRGRDLQQVGFIGNRSNFTSETSFIRTAHIMSKYKKTEFNNIWQTNLEGFKTENKDI